MYQRSLAENVGGFTVEKHLEQVVFFILTGNIKHLISNYVNYTEKRILSPEICMEMPRTENNAGAADTTMFRNIKTTLLIVEAIH